MDGDRRELSCVRISDRMDLPAISLLPHWGIPHLAHVASYARRNLFMAIRSLT
jgi:hypothetical protein